MKEVLEELKAEGLYYEAKNGKKKSKKVEVSSDEEESDEEVEDTFGNAPVNGIEFVPGDALCNAAVISSTDDGMIEFEVDGHKIVSSLRDLLINELGTSRMMAHHSML